MIVWLEDRESSIVSFRREIEKSSLPFQIISSIREVVAFLEDDAEIEEIIFVVDIMLTGVDDLNAIRVFNAPTGKGNSAGQVFVQRYLRAPGSQFAGCPVLFLTERDVDPQLEHEIFGIEDNSGGRVEIFKKYAQTDLKRFMTMLARLSSGEESREAPTDRQRAH